MDRCLHFAVDYFWSDAIKLSLIQHQSEGPSLYQVIYLFFFCWLIVLGADVRTSWCCSSRCRDSTPFASCHGSSRSATFSFWFSVQRKTFPYDKVCICGCSYPNSLSLRVFYLISSTRPFAIAIQIHIATEFSRGDVGVVIRRRGGVWAWLGFWLTNFLLNFWSIKATDGAEIE